MNTPLSADAWRERAQALPRDGRPFFDGQRVDADTAEHFDLIGACSGETLAQLPDCGQADVDRAVSSARTAFEDGRWCTVAPYERGRTLHRFADLIERDAEALALLDTLQMGMPVSMSTGGMGEAAQVVRSYADLADQGTDEVLASAPTALVMQRWRPRGVVAAITPWNFPVHVAVSRVAPALAAGNSVVLKPSELAPLSCLKLADLAAEAGLPPGVLNALPGRGSLTGRLLALHGEVDCLSFVGSSATGLQLMTYAGHSNMKRLLLECGGKSPQIVFDDVGDIESLADALVQGYTFNSGQVCVSGTRILVADRIYDRLLPLLAQRVEATYVRNPLDPTTLLGPLAHRQQHDRISRLLAEAPASDQLVARGLASGSNANEMPVHLYETADPGSALVQQELFGPIASVMRFGSEEQALALANGTRYGLAATVWCSDFSLAHRFVQRLRSGIVTVNAVARPSAPGNRYLSYEPAGLSGLGTDGGAAALHACLRLQALSCHLG